MQGRAIVERYKIGFVAGTIEFITIKVVFMIINERYADGRTAGKKVGIYNTRGDYYGVMMRFN